MTIRKLSSQLISQNGFTYKFKQSGKITCGLVTGSVQIKTSHRNVTLSFSQGFATSVEDNKPDSDSSEWTITITRASAQDATVDLTAPAS